jgi:hypothetical protein
VLLAVTAGVALTGYATVKTPLPTSTPANQPGSTPTAGEAVGLGLLSLLVVIAVGVLVVYVGSVWREHRHH